MNKKIIIKAERGTFLVTLIMNENEDGYGLCKEPVIAWCIEIDEKENYQEVAPLTVEGNVDDHEWAIQYPHSEENSFKYHIPFDRSYTDDKQLLADLIAAMEQRIASATRHLKRENKSK